MTLFSDNPEYDAFVAKFKPQKTTDDCYTPPLVYDAVRDWACNEYKIDPAHIVRPFYPGGDYEHYVYPDGCVVLDNPPFSILSKICKFYLGRNIPFFLFAPSLTAFSSRNTIMQMNHTAFVTSFGGGIIAQTAPELGKAIAVAVEKTKAEKRKEIPKYTYPNHVLTAAMLQKYSKYGIDFSVRRESCQHISKLDAQKEDGKEIYGGGLLLSNAAAAERAAAERAAAERAAAERAAAERAAATVWELSDRELKMVSELG